MTKRAPDLADLDPNEPMAPRTELLSASDAEIASALEHADPMVLRGLVYQLTGDPEIAATAVVAGTAQGFTGGIEASPDAAVLIRRKAAEFLKAYRDDGAGPIDMGPHDRLPESIALTMGKDLSLIHI